MKHLVALMSAIALALCCLLFVGCSSSLKIDQPTDELDGVTVEMTSAKVHVNDGCSYFETQAEITNESDVDVMQVEYLVTVKDAQGNALYDIEVAYNGETEALAPGESTTFNRPFQRVLDGKPASIGLEVTKVTSAHDMPPAHLPEKGEYLYQTLMETQGMPDITKETPESIVVGIDQGGYLREATFDTPATVKEAANAFAQIKVGAEINEFVTDNYNYIRIEYADGQTYGVSLNLHNLEMGTSGGWHTYELENLGDLWSMAESNAVEVNYDYSGDDA